MKDAIVFTVLSKSSYNFVNIPSIYIIESIIIVVCEVKTFYQEEL